MLNEAARCLDEGIIASARDGDIGAIFGIGFPPFLGGPFSYMDKLGASELASRLTSLSQLNQHFEPCQPIIDMAEGNQAYY